MDEAVRILLVDDDEVDRMAVRRALRVADVSIDVTEACNGAEGLRLLLEQPFDCALLDYQLPDRDGLEVLRSVRAANVRTPVIMLTGQGDEQLAVDMMKAGATDYLVKGRLSLDTLAMTIRHAIRVHRAEMGAVFANEKLRESESRFRSMADSAPVLIWISDREGRRTYFNKVWLNFAGRPLEREAGDGWVEGMHREDLPRWREIHERHVSRREPFEMEYRLRRHDGEYRWMFDRGIPLFLPGGAFDGFIGTCIDITERKKVEIDLKAAKESAEAANRAKDQFLAVLSHELRTPLTPVLTIIAALECEPGLSEEVRSGLDMIRRNAELEARLIDDLLDLTRISKGKLQLNLEPLDLHATVRNTLEICQADIDSKHLRLELDFQAEHHHVRADAARLQQVCWNLVKNAVKFTPEHGRLRIRTRNVPADRVLLEVSDTGIGIDRAWLPRIFDAFEQGEGLINRQFGGLGLGLAISKALIDMHGGRLAADSAGRGQGATFTIDMQTQQPVEQQPALPERLQPQSREALRILMVDDHEDTSRAMKRLLERLGYQVETAGTVEAALQATSRQRFDLLISDIGLPDGSGHDLMRRVQAAHGIKGIALSGFGMEEDLQKSREAGFAEHLTKPINFRRLEAAIKELSTRP